MKKILLVILCLALAFGLLRGAYQMGFNAAARQSAYIDPLTVNLELLEIAGSANTIVTSSDQADVRTLAAGISDSATRLMQLIPMR